MVFMIAMPTYLTPQNNYSEFIAFSQLGDKHQQLDVWVMGHLTKEYDSKKTAKKKPPVVSNPQEGWGTQTNFSLYFWNM